MKTWYEYSRRKIFSRIHSALKSNTRKALEQSLFILVSYKMVFIEYSNYRALVWLFTAEI